MAEQLQAETRRRLLRAGLAVVTGVAAAASARAESERAAAAEPGAAQPKFAPEAVHYQGTPNDWQKCLYCSYFKPPETCGILTAPVSRDGWCDHFTLLHE